MLPHFSCICFSHMTGGSAESYCRRQRLWGRQLLSGRPYEWEAAWVSGLSFPHSQTSRNQRRSLTGMVSLHVSKFLPADGAKTLYFIGRYATTENVREPHQIPTFIFSSQGHCNNITIKQQERRKMKGRLFYEPSYQHPRQKAILPEQTTTVL